MMGSTSCETSACVRSMCMCAKLVQDVQSLCKMCSHVSRSRLALSQVWGNLAPFAPPHWPPITSCSLRSRLLRSLLNSNPICCTCSATANLDLKHLLQVPLLRFLRLCHLRILRMHYLRILRMLLTMNIETTHATTL
jgi:hypothetical protein